MDWKGMDPPFSDGKGTDPPSEDSGVVDSKGIVPPQRPVPFCEMNFYAFCIHTDAGWEGNVPPPPLTVYYVMNIYVSYTQTAGGVVG